MYYIYSYASFRKGRARFLYFLWDRARSSSNYVYMHIHYTYGMIFLFVEFKQIIELPTL
jgi:hypothetical protein